ncbi:major head protein [Escherichia coli KTE233]|uniref:major capsid protein n=1 Tax=Escherichia coli TaxID=562 RepID=UPI0002A3AEE7|nr:major capsid protein [Escherichia coli]EEW2384661.1 minor capsid protein E [Escherichia coli]EFB4722331.1 hypothetical protein [Escherichia coli]EFC9651809.1 hypothetical protein [Escherichia coli]EFH4945988.1 hypothetical protein [Escherichia coli]EFN4083255.1 hypothetical protein [Escherichia coli]
MSMYTTAQLLAANEQKFKFDPLFLRLFFRESYPFTTEKVYLSQIPGLVNMALYVSPIVSGEVIRSRGGSTSEFTPGYVKPKHEVNPQMTLRRLPDEDPQNLADPAYRRRRIIMQNMRDEELAIAQVEEMQAVSAVLKGKYTMTGEAFDPVEVDMRGWTIKGKPASGRAVLSQEQDGIKSHTHSASASSTDLGTKTTSSFDYGTKSTNNTGAHTHSLSGSTNAAGNHSHRDGRRFNPSVFKDTYQYGYTSSGQNTWGVQGSVGMSTGWLANTSTDGNHSHSLSGTAASAGAHAHTVGIGAHTHSVAIGSHGHTITVNAAGNAENTVKNIAFNYIVRLA